MLRWTGLVEVPADAGPSVVSVGVFDGVHRGHAHVVRRAVARARELGARPVVVTFDPNPMAVLRPESAPPAVTSVPRRLDLLAELGVGATLVLPFTRELAAWSPGEFVDGVLVGALGARAVVVGQDFRFGSRASGDVPLLGRLGEARGFAVEGVGLVGEGGARWSSTYVRERIAAGDVAAAAGVLGRPHRLEGTVVAGDRRGRTIGYPTANLGGTDGYAVPADGVYAGRLVRAGGDALPAAVSVGTNPTFDGRRRRVEAYVLDRDDLDLYGEPVGLDLVERLRDTLRFADAAELVAQMGRDVERTRAVLRAAD